MNSSRVLDPPEQREATVLFATSLLRLAVKKQFFLIPFYINSSSFTCGNHTSGS